MKIFGILELKKWSDEKNCHFPSVCGPKNKRALMIFFSCAKKLPRFFLTSKKGEMKILV